MVKWYCLNSFDLLVDLKKGLMWMLPSKGVKTEPPRSSPVGVYYIQWYCIYILVVSSSYLASHFFFNIWTIIHDPYMIVLQYIFRFILVLQWYCCEPLQMFSLNYGVAGVHVWYISYLSSDAVMFSLIYWVLVSKQWDDSAAKEMEECCDASITSTNVEAMSIGNVTFLYLE